MEGFLSWWGAGLSTALAGIKILEIYRDRFKVETSYDFKPSEYGGNEIKLYNPGKLPIMIKYWELFRAKRFWPKSVVISNTGDVEGGDILIPAHSKTTLTFDEENYFSTNYDQTKKFGKLYIKLVIAGRRHSVTKLVYPKKPISR